MKKGLVGFLILIIGAVILILLFIYTQTKFLKVGSPDSQVDTQKVQNTVNDLENKLQQDQNKSLGVNQP